MLLSLNLKGKSSFYINYDTFGISYFLFYFIYFSKTSSTSYLTPKSNILY